jgi:hypothetical protein
VSERLPEWIEQKAAAGAAAFRLFVVGLDGTRSLVDVYPIQLGALEVLEGVEARALSQANSLGGSHAFQLEAVGEGGAQLGFELFRVTAEALPGGGSIATEPANAGGLVAQTMRHNEALMRSSVLSWEKTTRTQNHIIDRLATRLEKAEATWTRALELVEQASTAQGQREIDMMEAGAKIEMRAAAMEKIAQLAPVAIDAIAARKDPEGAAEATGANVLRAFVETLNPAQVQHVMGALSPEQQMMLGHVIKRMGPGEPPEKATDEAGNGDGKGDGRH